ncbi:lipid II flippase MurJ, partial [Mesorhizobium sp. M4A.F.Ca.ET.029.04.2.1]
NSVSAVATFTPGYFAREDTRTPMIFAAISVGVNVATALTLFPSMGAPGIAVASAVAGWVNAMMLLAMLIRRGHWGRDIPLLKRIPRLVLSAVIMATALYFAERHFATQIGPGSPLVVKATTVLALVAGGAALYFIAAFATGGADFGMIRRNVKRKSPPPVKEPFPDP